KGNQIVSGAGIILFATGFTSFMVYGIWGIRGITPSVTQLPFVLLPWLGRISPLIIFMFLMLPISWYVMYRTPFGLRLRAAGEDPSTLDTAGVNVQYTRLIGVILSGILAALGGAHLSIGIGSRFVELMTGGRGFIALAALIFGNWNPIGVVLAGLFFGFLTTLQGAIDALQAFNYLKPITQFIAMIPYISVIIALGVLRRSIPPKAIGVPYIKEREK
ncbi:MAG: ABC transporter permease, partial [Candidatus Hermodarchaeota archaeon]|nr:ABC transporter permease [Candidatus Hermodarchaeota archaeon]